jgi:hypothetical protein
MPTYVFHDTKENEQFEMIMKISEREIFLRENPQIQPVITAPNIVSGVSSSQRIPSGFNDVLLKVAEAHPKSTVGERHKLKSIKEVRTDRLVKKYVDRITKL